MSDASSRIDPNVPGIDRTLALREARLPGYSPAVASYTPDLADLEKLIRFNSATASTFVVPLDDKVNFPIGSVLTVARDGAGSVAIGADAGVTVNRDANTQAAIAAQYGLVNLRKTAANTWSLFGAVAVA